MNETNVAVLSEIATNPVTVPPYSVMRVDIETPPVLTFLNGASMRSPGTEYQWAKAATDEQIVAILPNPQSVPVLFLEDSTDKVLRVETTPLTPTEVKFIVPSGLAPGPIRISNLTFAAPDLVGNLDLTGVVPGIYSANQNGAGVAVGSWTNPTTNKLTLTFTCMDVPMSCLPQPVLAGVSLQLLGTGFRYATHLQGFVAGKPAVVTSFGAYDAPGTDQVTLAVPYSLTGAGNSSVYIIADGQRSNMTTIKIQ
jgi:uncharacterized protein (TIGR03437 family)